MKLVPPSPGPPPVKLDYRCAACGYGVHVVPSTLPRCPMCGTKTWVRPRGRR